jgi:predicted nucleic acid-binding protein
MAAMTDRVPLRDVFVDTSVLLAALIDFGPRSAAALALFDIVVASRDARKPKTAWHCCLETYSVATRLPEEFRVQPSEAATLIEEEVVRRFEIVDLPQVRRLDFLRDCGRAGVRGGRLYDAHIGSVAGASRAKLIVTENRRDFAGLEATAAARIVDASESLKLIERGARKA